MLVVLVSLFNTSSLLAIILVGMWPHLRMFIIVSSLSLWLGGLTFYSAVVVPIANRTLGSDQQGRVTQQVTNYLNVIAVVTFLVLLGDGLLARNRALVGLSALLIVAQILLLFIHRRLDEMMAMSQQQTFDHAAFYFVHQQYLIVTTVQWLVGLAALWCVLAKARRPASKN